jgi:ankyrin repeat protein
VQAELEHGKPAFGVCFSPDGAMLAAEEAATNYAGNGKWKVWDLATGAPVLPAPDTAAWQRDDGGDDGGGASQQAATAAFAVSVDGAAAVTVRPTGAAAADADALRFSPAETVQSKAVHVNPDGTIAVARGTQAPPLILVPRGLDLLGGLSEVERFAGAAAAFKAAAAGGDVEAMRLLLDRGAEADSESGAAALKASAAGGHVEAMRLLLDRGAKADSESGAAALKASAAGGHVEAVRLLLDRGANADGESGAAALSAAAACGHVEAMRLLLERGAKADGESGAAALSAAATANHAEAVRLLLDRGAKADGESGAPALRAATSDDVKALLREHGATLTLLEECRDGNAAAIAQLLDGGADMEAKGDSGARPTKGDEVLIVSGEGAGSVATVTFIGFDQGGNTNISLEGAMSSTEFYKEAQVSVQATALTVAACGGHVEEVRLLLDRGAKADGESGAAARRAATSDDVKALLAPAGRSA